MSTNLFLSTFETAAASIPSPWAAPPADSTGYGTDLSCTDDCTSLFDEVTGTRVVADAAWRAITSDLGSIPDCTEATLDLRSLLRRAATPTEVSRWSVLVRNAILSGEDRIADVTVVATQLELERWQLKVQGTTSVGTTFSLVGELTPTSAILKEILA